MPNRRRWHFEVEELKLDIRFVSETETETESAGTGGESEERGACDPCLLEKNRIMKRKKESNLKKR